MCPEKATVAEYVQLSNGVLMPMLGMGTTHSGGYSCDAVTYALSHCGYRMIDTARRYGTEPHVARSIARSGIAREQVFIATKLWPMDFGFGSTLAAFENSCARLNTTYIDLYLIHCPYVPDCLNDDNNAEQLLMETWRAMELLFEQGRCRAIGVSNFEVADLELLLSYARVKPHVNQCEFHPYYQSIDVKEYCDQNGIVFTGYCPLAKGRVLNEPSLVEIAHRYGRTPAQICLRWSIQRGVAVIPKSTRISRVLTNSQIFDFTLSASDLSRIDALQDITQKCVRFDTIQMKFNLPDGYKMARTNSTTADQLATPHNAPLSIGVQLNAEQHRGQSVPNNINLMLATTATDAKGQQQRHQTWSQSQLKARKPKIFDFTLSASDLSRIDALQDITQKCVRFDTIQMKFNLPDGYKMARTNSTTADQLATPHNAPLSIGVQLNAEQHRGNSVPNNINLMLAATATDAKGQQRHQTWSQSQLRARKPKVLKKLTTDQNRANTISFFLPS